MARNSAYYSLGKVKSLVKSGNCSINSKARVTARNDFGWDFSDITNAILKLQHSHYYKTEKKYDDPSVFVDYYRANNLMGENVYIHFRVENDCLVICSFKEI
ncbi:type II toxin-antitoxin system MqsR family toxin [Desulfonatronovibrio magnus]|uniref:type II toxin-antitoxin system MqsR family toxin n=1 Tax=Desulfonatronovibrio magnus TaxID=698827 RepID=UPI0005EB093B|nr:type II toxin-antitoxin system MqsR family toxin [Desulfonatronovibrio magnus]